MYINFWYPIARADEVTSEGPLRVEVFGLPRPEFARPLYRFATAAVEPGPLRAAGGLRCEAAGGVDGGNAWSRGATFFDADNDGDLDIISLGWKSEAVVLYENKASSLK